MKKYDFGAYLDGSMSATERAEMEASLAQCPDLRRELEGYQAFAAALHDAGQSQIVPQGQLEAMLAQLAKPRFQLPHWTLPVAAPALAAVMILGFFLLRPKAAEPDPLALATSKALAALDTNDPSTAANWVAQRTGIQTNPIRLASFGGEMEGCEAGSDWACFDYGVQGETVCVSMGRSDCFEKAKDCESCDDCEFFIGRGVGFRQNGVSYYISGSNPQRLLAYAKQIRAEIVGDNHPIHRPRGKVNRGLQISPSKAPRGKTP